MSKIWNVIALVAGVLVTAHSVKDINAAKNGLELFKGLFWCIKTIDKYHMLEVNDNQSDRQYKGIKNNIRYEYEMGVDPAPRYPVLAELTKSEGV